MRHIRLYCQQASGSKTVLKTVQTPNAFKNRNGKRNNLRILTRIFSALNQQKNGNTQPRPEKHCSYKKKECIWFGSVNLYLTVISVFPLSRGANLIEKATHCFQKYHVRIGHIFDCKAILQRKQDN